MPTVAIATLGCKVNQYDSQAMLEGFLRQGYQQRSFEDICDVYVVNTCTVTGTSDQKSRKLIRQAARRNPGAVIVVAGCLAQRDADAAAAMPGVRLVLGTRERARAAELLTQALRDGQTANAVESLEGAAFEEADATIRESRTRAVLKIQDGCDRRCAYCIIPKVRGNVRSRTLDSIEKEARRLAEAGFAELVLTGIHLCSYGRDMGGASLLDAMERAALPEGIRRIRLGSMEPAFITPDVADRLADMPKLCRQFHLSLQSGHDGTLRAMRRGYTADRFAQSVALLRRAMPGCAITTDVITGFPGEDEEAFLGSATFCQSMAFSRMHVFPYSEREGTEAARLPGAIPMETRRERAQRLIALGLQMEAEYAREQTGKVVEVLLEEEGEGLTREYLRAIAPGGMPGDIRRMIVERSEGGAVYGRWIQE